MSKYRRLLGEAAAAAKAAREIAEKAQADNGRDMTDDERSDFDAHIKAAQEKKQLADAAKADEDVLAQAKAWGAELGLDGSDLDAQGGDPQRDLATKSLGEVVTSSPQFKAMLSRFTSSDGTVRIGEKMQVQSDPISFKTLIRQKALFVGGDAASVGSFVTPDRTDILEMLGRRPLTLRDLISVRRTTSDTVEYVKQTSHTNAAAPVAEATSSAAPTAPATGPNPLVLNPNGGYKPEGAWAFEKMTATVRTIAEWVPATKRALADVAQLEGLINDELVADLAEAEETQIVSGNGSGENLRGILNTVGLQTTAAVTTNDATRLASVRTAIRLLRTVGRVAASGILVNPADAEKIDTMKDTTNRFYGNGPFGIGPKTLWGVPYVESEAITAGTLLAGDFSKAVLWDREQASVTVSDSHADFFIRNLVAILAEERVAFAVTRPTAFCTITGF